MDLQNLRLFLRVADMQSFSLAALASGVAQPTVSRVIKELEVEWGDRLFHRTGRGVTLTEFGEIARTRARALLAEADQMVSDFKSMGRELSGQVTLGLSPSLAPTVVPALVNQLAQEVPGISLRIREGFSDQIERWRAAGEIDIGVWSNFRTFETDAGPSKALFASNLVLVASGRASPLPPEIDFADLARYRMVLPALPNGLRAICEDIARRNNARLNIAVETESIVVQKQLCQHCGCHLIKAPETIAEETAQGVYRVSAIVNPVVQRYLLLETTRQRPISRAAREVASRLTVLLRVLSPS